MMNGKVRAFNGDMGMAMSVFKDMVGKVRFVFADPPYKITQARYDKEGFDYKAMWEVIQKMLCPYGVVAVTCSLTAAVEIMRVAPAGWYRYDLVWHKKCIDKDNRFTPIKQLLGYYYYVEVYKYQNIDMVSESANLVKLYEQKQIANDVVFEMIFHPNGNLNGSWVDDEDILLAYNPYKS